MFHYGGVIINPKAKIGNNVIIMHGVTIGNNMPKGDKCPTIGDNVFIGAGAKILGEVYLAKGVKVGANAVVVRSVYEEGVTVIGVPARIVRK